MSTKPQKGHTKTPDCSSKIRPALTKVKELISCHQYYKAISLLWNLAEKFWGEGHVKSCFTLVKHMIYILEENISLKDHEPREELSHSQICHMLFLGKLCIYNMSLLFSRSLPSPGQTLLLSDALETKFSWGMVCNEHQSMLKTLAQDRYFSAKQTEPSLNQPNFKGKEVLNRTIGFLLKFKLNDTWLTFLCWIGFYYSDVSHKTIYLKILISLSSSSQSLFSLAEACISNLPDPECLLLAKVLLIQGLLNGDEVLVNFIFNHLSTTKPGSDLCCQKLLSITKAALNLDLQALYQMSCQRSALSSGNEAFLAQLAEKVIDLKQNLH
ncbi:hypothetical protein DSO57_1030066 [Entomophthora muscae]|uniref:Uncharacterized protein n=1 Tax=Entomophthora muscae TaxID=34485 RepID=A0ACC2S2W4_9FUNG|nr:hypothetical protein DSO57_1030066 [Entomophthora muscae]